MIRRHVIAAIAAQTTGTDEIPFGQL